MLLAAQCMYFTDSLDEWMTHISRLSDELEYLNTQYIIRHKDKPRVLVLGSPLVFPNYKVPQLIASAGMSISAVADSQSLEAAITVTKSKRMPSADSLLKKIARVHLNMISSGARINNTGLYSYVQNLIQCIDVTTSDCIMCGECVRRCPENNALAITFCGKKIYNADRMKFMKQYAPPQDKKKGKHHE